MSAPAVTPVKAPPSPPSADGIDWTDAGIGAGSLLGLTALSGSEARSASYIAAAVGGSPPDRDRPLTPEPRHLGAAADGSPAPRRGGLPAINGEPVAEPDVGVDDLPRRQRVREPGS